MSKELTLSVANPCSESWDQMSPRPGGRFCSSCSKTVVNFATMTDQQVLDWFEGHAGSVCGRFHPAQLGRPLAAEPPSKKSSLGRYWHYFLAFLLSSSELAAQGQPAKPPTTQQVRIGEEAGHLIGDTVMAPERTSPPTVLHGRLVDEYGRSVPFASILYKEHAGLFADSGGCFSIPAANLTGVSTLTITAIGYETLKVNLKTLNLAAGVQPLLIMKMEPLVLGKVATVVHRRRRKPIADTIAVLKDTVATCFNFPKTNLTLYPNPVPRGNSITISAQLEKSGTYGVQLFDLSGTLLQSTTADRDQLSGHFTLPLPATMSPGTYLVRISHPALNKVYTQQIVVL